MNRMSRKIVVAEVITDLHSHGAERMLYNLLSMIDRSKFTPLVFTLVDGILSEKIVALGIPIYSMNLRRGQIPSFRLLRDFSRKINQFGPDIIHGWMYHGNMVALLLRFFNTKKIPLIWAIHNSIYSLKDEKLLTRLVIIIGAFLSRYASSIQYVSKRSAVQHEQLNYRKNKTIIIPNGFNTDLFVPSNDARESLRIELGLMQNPVLIGLIGRYDQKKDHENFLLAASILLKEFNNVHFIMVGKDISWENKILTGKIQELKIQNNIHLLGQRNDIQKLSAALDIGCLSSYSEAFPMTIGEIMSCGVPCISTDVGDSSRIIGNSGLVVPPRDAISLMKAMKKFIDIDEKGRAKLGESARKRIIKKFSLKNIVNKYEMIYQYYSIDSFI